MPDRDLVGDQGQAEVVEMQATKEMPQGVSGCQALAVCQEAGDSDSSSQQCVPVAKLKKAEYVDRDENSEKHQGGDRGALPENNKNDTSNDKEGHPDGGLIIYEVKGRVFDTQSSCPLLD